MLKMAPINSSNSPTDPASVEAMTECYKKQGTPPGALIAFGRGPTDVGSVETWRASVQWTRIAVFQLKTEVRLLAAVRPSPADGTAGPPARSPRG
jgi:hypothetical protein